MRADGKYIGKQNPIETVGCHVMNQRTDAVNMIDLDLPLQQMNDYIRRKHEQGITVTHLMLVIAAYLRAISRYPQLNRFVVNKRMYARRELAVSMYVLKENGDEGTINKMYFRPEDTILDVQKTVVTYIDENRKTDTANTTDKTAHLLVSIPGLLRIGVSLCKLLDKFGILPYSLIQASPFHASLLITNLASIRTNSVFHHIYNFGTTSIALSMGIPHDIPVRTADGYEFVRCMPLGVSLDDRICNGAYYAQFFRAFRHYLQNPEELEVPPEHVEYEVAYRK